MISVKLNLTKIDKSKIFVGKDGAKYIDIVLLDKKNQYGDYMVVQSISKAERESGKQAPILGNGKIIGASTQQSSPPPAQQQSGFGLQAEGDLPF